MYDSPKIALAQRASAMKTGIGAWAEVLCRAAFAAAGCRRGAAVERWRSSGGQRVVVVAPHPDDEVVGCAGTLIRHRQAGDAVCVVYVTDGSASRAGGMNRTRMSQVRRQEAGRAATALESCSYEWLGLVEGAWSSGELDARLKDVLARLTPDLLYVPSRVDFHPEHHRVARAVARALADGAGVWPGLMIRIYQAQVPLTPLLVNIVTETESVSAQTRAAFRAHASQSASIVRTLRSRRYAGRYYRATNEAEEFWQLTAKQYALLHSSAEKWHQYVSLRANAIFDARAYLSHWGDRRALRAASLRLSAES